MPEFSDKEYSAILHFDGNTHEFRFIGGPIDESDGTDDLFAAMGRAACAWARLEKHIDAVLIQVNKATHSEDLYDPNHPRPFSGKREMLKDYFNKHPALTSHQDLIRELTSRLGSLALERNGYLHSILEYFDPATETAIFNTIEPKGNGRFKLARQTATLEQIRLFTRLTIVANILLSTISHQLFTTDALEQLQKR